MLCVHTKCPTNFTRTHGCNKQSRCSVCVMLKRTKFLNTIWLGFSFSSQNMSHDCEILRSIYNNNKRLKTLYRHDGERGGKLMRATLWASFTRNFLRSGLLAETLVFITIEQSLQVPETASCSDLRLPICNKRNQKEDIKLN